jgi:hypothetical protein
MGARSTSSTRACPPVQQGRKWPQYLLLPHSYIGGYARVHDRCSDEIDWSRGKMVGSRRISPWDVRAAGRSGEEKSTTLACCPCGRAEIPALSLCTTCYTLKRQDEKYMAAPQRQQPQCISMKLRYPFHGISREHDPHRD